MDIDELIEKLQEAKKSGHTKVMISSNDRDPVEIQRVTSGLMTAEEMRELYSEQGEDEEFIDNETVNFVPDPVVVLCHL